MPRAVRVSPGGQSASFGSECRLGTGGFCQTRSRASHAVITCAVEEPQPRMPPAGIRQHFYRSLRISLRRSCRKMEPLDRRGDFSGTQPGRFAGLRRGVAMIHHHIPQPKPHLTLPPRRTRISSGGVHSQSKEGPRGGRPPPRAAHSRMRRALTDWGNGHGRQVMTTSNTTGLHASCKNPLRGN